MATVDIGTMGEARAPSGDWAEWGSRLLGLLDRPDAEVSVLFCDDETIRPLNRDWRGKDSATDVLSFSQLEGECIGDPNVLGDVIISVPTAQRQAHERGHDLVREVQVLFVHGVCHLLGYDHERDDEAVVMEALERKLLTLLDVDDASG